MEFKRQALIVFDRNGIIISEYYNDIEPDQYVELLESIKEHLFLLKRMEEEPSYEYDHDISTIKHRLFSYLHRLNLKSELFFVSAVTKEHQKEELLEKFPDFLDDLSKILSEMI